MRLTALLFLLSIPCMCHGANVIWGDIEVSAPYSGDNGETQRLFKEFLGHFAMFIECVTENVGAGDFSVTVTCQHYATPQSLMVAVRGDVVSEYTTSSLADSAYLLRHKKEDDDGTEIRSGTFLLGTDTSVYLSFICSDFQVHPVYCPIIYGWMALSIDKDGVLHLVSSAYDLEGGPMVVGGGAWTGGIPEPSGGMLMLLGLAALGLRRRSHGTA